jgi:hypothetical protein
LQSSVEYGLPGCCGHTSGGMLFDEGVLVFPGEVSGYYLKHPALPAVIGFSSIERIANRIRVTDGEQA